MKTAVSRFAVLGVVLMVATLDPVSADYRVERELTLAPGGVLTLRVDTGRLTVRGTPRPNARIVVTADTDDFENRFDLTFEETPEGVTIGSQRRGSWTSRWFSWGNDRVHFEVEVPHETALDLRTSGGRVDIADIHDDVEARTSGGRIEVAEVTGDARLRTSGGSITFAQIGGGLEAETSGGSIRGSDARGDVDVDTSGGSIRLEGMGGAVMASTSGGSVTVHFAPGNSQGGSLTTSGGRVTAYLDPDAELDIDASSSGAGVTLDLPVAVQGEVSKRKVLGTLNGGGAELRLRSSGGGVRVKGL